MRLAAARVPVAGSLLAALAGLGSPPSFAGDQPNPVAAAASRFLKACSAGDEAVQSEIAADPRLDPVDLAGKLYLWHLTGRKKPATSTNRLAAMRSLARRASKRPDARELEALVERHATLDEGVLDRDEKRQAAWAAARQIAEAVARADAIVKAAPREDEAPATLLSAAILADAAASSEAAGRTADAAALYGASARASEALPWPRLVAQAWEASARLRTALAQWREAADALDRSIEAYASLSSESLVVMNLLNLSVTRRRQGRVDAALAAAGRAEALAARLGDARSVRTARRARAVAWIEVGAWPEAEALLRAQIDEVERGGRSEDPGAATAARINLALLLHKTGRLAEALTISEDEIARLEKRGPSSELGTACRNAAVIFREMGLHERALSLHEKALAAYQAVDDRPGVVASLLNLGVVATTLRRFDEARA